MNESLAAIVFTILTGIVIIFQGCLVIGLPWGKASMGGKYPGKYPLKMKVVAIINIFVLSLFIGIVLSKANLIYPQLKYFSNIGIWLVVAFMLIGTVLNTITKSKIERIWIPVSLFQLITSIILAIS
jgi:hypothetical protein